LYTCAYCEKNGTYVCTRGGRDHRGHVCDGVGSGRR
jgi:hypothetical protein